MGITKERCQWAWESEWPRPGIKIKGFMVCWGREAIATFDTKAEIKYLNEQFLSTTWKREWNWVV